MHLCPGNCVVIGHAVVYYALAPHAFSAEFKWRHCRYHDSCLIVIGAVPWLALVALGVFDHQHTVWVQGFLEIHTRRNLAYDRRKR